MSKRHQGRNRHRLDQNPQERKFARLWEHENRHPRSIVDYLMNGDGGLAPKSATDEQCEVAATVIQWLGSPVGEGFLRDVGYTRTPGGKE